MKSMHNKFCITLIALTLMFLLATPAAAQIVRSGSTVIDLSQAERGTLGGELIGTDEELLVNGGFETGDFPPWYHDGYWSISTTNPHAGTYCAYDVGNHWLRQDITSTPQSEITSVTLWCRQPEEAISAIDFFYDNGTYSEDIIWPTMDWQEYNVTGFITPGMNVVAIRVWGYSGGGPDPDETYFDDISIQTAGGPPNVTITLDLVGGPVVIPPTGGSFDYVVAINNNTGSTVTFDAWIDAELPTGAIITIVNRELTLLGAGSISRTLTQYVPAAAPPGLYTVTGYVGDYPTIWDDDSFWFEKLSDHDGGAVCTGDDFILTGFEDPLDELTCAEVPAEFELLGNYPNPFNPSTTLSFALPKAALVNLAIYDISGSQVATLIDGWRDEGVHEATFDGTGLASGVYIYQLQSENITACGKMILIK